MRPRKDTTRVTQADISQLRFGLCSDCNNAYAYLLNDPRLQETCSRCKGKFIYNCSQCGSTFKRGTSKFCSSCGARVRNIQK